MKSSYAERFAEGRDPEPLDKDFVRRHYVSIGYVGEGAPPPLPDDVRVGAAQRYIEAFERITGNGFQPNTEEPIARIRKNLTSRTASA
jgi:phosphoribosylaminoimidazole-succinocarboxamide synthase